MIKLNGVVKETCKVSQYITKTFPNINYSTVQKCLRNKDVIVNGKRINTDQKLICKDLVEFFVDENTLPKRFSIFYEDENVLIINKSGGIEVCDGDYNVLDELKKEGKIAYAVHRLDRNTTGLVVFAKTENVKNILDKAFATAGVIDKVYTCKVLGCPQQKQAELQDYLVKNSEQAEVKIYKTAVKNSSQIITKYKVLKTDYDTSVLEINILTGKTHQIRAHLAFYNLPILGDYKYGNVEQNNYRREKNMLLCANKINFNFKPNNKLFYLNDKNFEIKCKFL